MVSVLYVRADSVYKTLGVDCWDIDRDARTWPGGNPIVAHPPCRAWGRLSWSAKPRPGEKELAIRAVEQIRKYGGVLEHPRASRLWPTMNLPMGDEVDAWGGFTVCVDQFWFGHRAKKTTLLYICGIHPRDLPPYPIRFDRIDAAICRNVKRSKNTIQLKEVSKKEREATPIEFAKWLIEVAQKCKK